MLKKSAVRRTVYLLTVLSFVCFSLISLVTVFAVPSQDLPGLLITELVVNSNNAGGIDAYEFVEIYNNTGTAVNMSDYRLFYHYPNSSPPDVEWDITEGTTIPDKATFLVWVRDESNPSVAALTKTHFWNEYDYRGSCTPEYNLTGAFGIADDRIAIVNCTGMSNTSPRTIILKKDNDASEICKVSYTAEDVATQALYLSDPKKSIHYRYDESGSAEMIKMGVDYANPGTYKTIGVAASPQPGDWDQVPKFPKSYSHGVATLSVTELCPATTSLYDEDTHFYWDAYEYIELFNNTSSNKDLDDYHIDYSGVTWEISGTGVAVPAYRPVVLWIKNDGNTDLTKQDFKEQYGISMDDDFIVEISCNGMFNGGAKTISVVRDSDNEVLSSASYDPDHGDVENNKGIEYQLNPSSKADVQVELMGVVTANPGIVKPGQGLTPWYAYGESFNIPPHDYSFGIIPDPQYYAISDSLSKAQADYMYYFANAQFYGINNLKHVMCVGDLVDYYNSSTQWGRASAAFDILNSNGVSYGVVSGNHDWDITEGVSTMDSFNDHFGQQIFSGKPGFGEYHQTASMTDGMYFTVTQDTDNYIILYLGNNAGYSSSLRAWAKGVFDNNSTKTGILITHDYLKQGDGYSDDPEVLSPASREWTYSGTDDNSRGYAIFDEIVSECANVRYVICGHTSGAYHRAVPLNGRTVQEIVLDFQTAATPLVTKYCNLDNGENGAHFGMGMVSFMFIDKANSMIHFRTYSPWAQKNGWYDRFGPDNDSFDVPLSLQ